MDPGSLDTFISIFPSQKLIDYWHARWKTSVAKNSDALAQGFALVLLSNQYQIHEQFTESNNILSFFEDLVGEKALDELQRAIYGNDVSDRSLGYQEYKEKLFSRYLPCKKIDYQQMKDDMIGYENSLLFLTTLYVAGKGNIALLQDDSSSWDCISWSKLAHWLAGQHLRSQGLSDTRISNCMRITMARLMFNCAVRKDIFEYHFLVKSFQYFEGMIERNIQKKSLTRRMDTEIIPSEQSVVAILNMAACFLELRNLTKCRALIEQARKLIKSSVKDLSFSEAYANYIDGVSHFEETSPIKSSLNGSNANNHFSASHLKKKYQTSIKLLKQNASVLRESHPDAPLTASALTMLAVVSANEAADFTTEVLVSFKEALDFESKHETRTLTATFLYQMLRTSVSMKPATSICTELFNRAEALFSARRSATAVQQENRKAESNPNTGESSKITEPSSGLDIELNDTSDIFIIIDKSRRYLDAHRQASLAHFKKLLKLCSKDTEIATQILCNLFICRHHRQSQYLNKAESRHKKSTRLIRNIFGIDLDSTVDLDASRLNGQRLFNHKELSFLVSFWLINKGMLILGEASVLSQKESASKVKRMIDFPHDRNLTSISQVAVLVSQKIADKRSKAKVKWTYSRNTIGRAKRIFQSLKLSLEDNEKPAFSFLSRYMADAFFNLNDFLAFDDRYKNDPQLVFAVVDFLKDADDLGQKTPKAEETTAEDLLHYLHSTAINMPSLSRYMKRLPMNKAGLRTLGKFQDLEVILTVSNTREKLKSLQRAYDMCHQTDLFDTELHAQVHFEAGIELMRQAYMDPFKPHYSNFNAAILKLRKAARIFEQLYGDDARTVRCYAILSLLYCHQVQLEDQESRCLSCLEKCSNIETRLVAKDSGPSPWVWKCLEVIRDGKAYFKQLSMSADKKYRFLSETDQWTHLFKKIQTAVKRDVPYCAMLPASNEHHPDPSLLADSLFDPLEEWEEKRNRSLKAIAVMMWDREFPKDSPPSDTEVRCYAQYLTKLFNRHWHFCPVPQKLEPEKRCPLDNLEGSPDEVLRNHFLEGLSAYSTSNAEDKSRILKRLQRNHNLLLTKCQQAIRCHDTYEVAY